MTTDEIIVDFDLLDDWEDRYRYVIELGKRLAPMAGSDQTEANRVRGCASQVWLTSRADRADGRLVLRFTADSDALIVRGLIAIALALFDGKSPRDIMTADAERFFDRLELREHLTAQRSNGLHALVSRIRSHAQAVAIA